MNVSSDKIIIVMILLAITLSAIYYLQYVEIRADYEMDKYVLNDQGYSYNLFSPDIKYELDSKLNEISGLSYVKDDQLACIQDEEGILYIYDLIKEDISKEIKFEGNGDYEGVEVIDDVAFVLKSNGHIYRFSLSEDTKTEAEKIETSLNSKNDTEGLGYLQGEQRLLIACKESGDSKEVDVKGKAIYQYSVKDNRFMEDPLIIFSDDNMEENLEKFGLNKTHFPFKPSAISIHPQTGNVYILSSTAKLLLVCDTTGTIQSMTPLDRGIFKQPEGICFAPDGRLYISSEGKGAEGYILLFDPE